MPQRSRVIWRSRACHMPGSPSSGLPAAQHTGRQPASSHQLGWCGCRLQCRWCEQCRALLCTLPESGRSQERRQLRGRQREKVSTAGSLEGSRSCTCHAEAGAQWLVDEEQGGAPGPGACTNYVAMGAREDVLATPAVLVFFSRGTQQQTATARAAAAGLRSTMMRPLPLRSAPGLACNPRSSSTS